MQAHAPRVIFPFGVTALALTVGALAAGGVAMVVAGAAGGDASAAMMMSSFVWLVSLMSLLAVAALARRSAWAMAMGHFAATGLRLVLTLALAVVAIKRLGLAAEAVLLSGAGVYFALVMIESVCVARFVRRAYHADQEAGA